MFDAMEAPEAPHRQALMFVRLVAGCALVIGLLEVGLYLTKCFIPKPPLPVEILPLAVNSIPLVIGVVVLIKAKAIAAWIAEKFE